MQAAIEKGQRSERKDTNQKWRRMEIGPWRLALGGRESLPGAIEDVKLDKPKSRGGIELRMWNWTNQKAEEDGNRAVLFLFGSNHNKHHPIILCLSCMCFRAAYLVSPMSTCVQLCPPIITLIEYVPQGQTSHKGKRPTRAILCAAWIGSLDTWVRPTRAILS